MNGCTYQDPRCAQEDVCYCGGEPDNAPEVQPVQYARSNRIRRTGRVGFDSQRIRDAIFNGTITLDEATRDLNRPEPLTDDFFADEDDN